MSILSKLPPVEFVSEDVGQIEANVITTYEAIAGRKLAPGDPVRLFLQSIAAIIAQQRVLINYTGKQNLLAYAKGANLDHKGVDTETERLPVQAAKTTERFILSAPQPQAVIIPAGTRVTPDGKLFFAVKNSVTVPTGTLQIDIEVECTTPGSAGNGWQVGQINKLVDPLPWVQKVENITVSSGGTDEEDDDSYRERIRQAPERFSTAGPEGAYIYWAKTAHQDIMDVAVESPAPGEVNIYVLLKDGQIPGAEILEAVNAICSDKKVRPLTDKVSILAPEAVDYDIVLTYWISIENANMAATIQQAVNQAIEDYKTWQRSKLGRDINPSELIARVMTAGARRVTLTSPVYANLNLNQIALAQNVSVQFGGIEDD